MNRKLMCLLLIVLIGNAASGLTVLAAKQQDDKEAKATEKIKTKVAKVGFGTDSKVEVRLKSGERKKGSITEIKADSFTLVDETTKSPSVISYAQVRQFNKKSLTKGLAIAGIVVGVVSVIGLVVAAKE